jgi:hypothetical protein
MNQHEFLEAARAWQKRHPAWELICDMKETESLYVQFNEMPAKDRMRWIGKYRDGAVRMWNECGVKKCKVERLFLNSDMQLVSEWPTGPAMTCFKTDRANTTITKGPTL